MCYLQQHVFLSFSDAGRTKKVSVCQKFSVRIFCYKVNVSISLSLFKNLRHMWSVNNRTDSISLLMSDLFPVGWEIPGDNQKSYTILFVSSEIASRLVLRKVRFQVEDSLFNILVLIRFPPEFRLAGIPICLQSCILHIEFSRFSPLTDAVTVFITVRVSFDRFNLADSTVECLMQSHNQPVI